MPQALSSLLSWMPGWLESLPTDIAQSMMCAISRTHDGPKVVLCFRHATPSHYHHDAWLLACVKHIKFILYRGCVSGVIVLSYSVIYIYIYIYISREHRDLVSVIDVQSMVCANDRIHYGLHVVFVCLQITASHYNYYADLSKGIELLKCLSGIWCRVCV